MSAKTMTRVRAAGPQKTLAELVAATGESINALAATAGISPCHISNLKAGRFTRVSHTVFKGLANALQVSDSLLENALKASKESANREM